MKTIVLRWLPWLPLVVPNLLSLTKKEQIKDRRYSLLLLLFTLLFTLQPALAQNNLTVTGTVSDENGMGLPGVTITLKEVAGKGTVSDMDGKYSLQISQGNEEGTLVFSFIGYTTEEIPVGSKTVVDVQLLPDVKTLSEVVVVGYGTQSKKDLTGSVASVDPEALKSLPVPSVSDAVQGRAAGVQVITTGEPGADATFRIRGVGTINNANPLLVINGVPVEGGLNQLNPNDIESIQVLKDASAAAIYGSRGANGVVIVTTKRGTGSQGRMNVDVFTGIQQATNTVEMLNASQFAALHNEMMANNGQAQNPAFADPASLGAGTDWVGALLRPAPISSYSLSYAGSSEKSNYYVSGNVLDQQGIIINTGFRRYTVQFNSDTKLFDRIKFGNNLTLNHDIKTRGDHSIRNTMAALPTQPIYNSDGTYSGPVGQPSWVGDITNPIGKATLVEQSTKGYNVIGSAFGEVEILDGLSFKSTVGLQANFWYDRTWAPKYNWQPIPEPESFLSQSSNRNITWLWDNMLTYDKVFNTKHHLTVLAGTSAQASRFDGMNASIKGFVSDQTQQLSNGTQTDLATIGGNANHWSLMSYIGRVNYSFDDRYLFTGTIRRDGSSRFGPENRWGVFPSGSVAWRISEENFFKGVKAFNDLKLRAGYGVTGNQQIDNYSYVSFFNTAQYNFNGNIVSGAVPTRMANPFVQWETVRQSNIGLDAAFLNSRLSVTLDVYLKNTTDMLVPMAVPISSGYSDTWVPYINAGKVENKGVELTITSNNINKRGFTWNTDFNISYNQNKIISLNDTVPMMAGSIGFNYNLARLQAGHPINAFYGFMTNGIFQTQEEVDNYATQVAGEDPNNRTSPGDIRFLDLNNDGVIDDNDRTFIGNPNPKFIFAVNNSFTFKGFDLSIFLQGVQGNKIFNANRIWTEGMAVAQNQTTATLGRWNGAGTSNTMPRAVFNDPNKNTRASDRYIEDGSYLRVKNITLGYTLPSKLTQRIKMSSARLYASAQNLYTLTKYSGLDPEVSGNGIDFNVYPVTRTISLGVNIGF
jgi:TonB-linked SusC/RagA family outer membrane protein